MLTRLDSRRFPAFPALARRRALARVGATLLAGGSLVGPATGQWPVLLRQTSSAEPGGTLQVDLSGLTPGGNVAFGLASGDLVPPLVLPGIQGPEVLAPPFQVFPPVGPATVVGSFSASFAIPSLPSLSGDVFHLQAFDLAGLALSNPAAVYLGPPAVLVPGPASAVADYGWSVAVGDFLGDAALDIAVGAPGAGVGAVYGAGTVEVFEGSGFATSVTLTAPVPTINSGFGHSLAALDFDGDGVTELAVGEPGEDSSGVNAGRVCLFSAPVGGLPDFVLTAPLPASYENLGWGLAAGDLDLDGKDELVAGAPGIDIFAFFGTRRVVIFHDQGAAGIVATSVSDPDAPVAYSGFGASIAVAQLDNIDDGSASLAELRLEIVVGNPGYFFATSGASEAQDVVHVFDDVGALKQTLPAPSPFPPAGQSDGFGRSLAVGKLNADGEPDILVGQPSQDRAWVLYGPDFGTSLSLDGVAPAGSLSTGVCANAGDSGRSVAIADVDGDGFDDALVASPVCISFPAAPCGEVSLYLGPAFDARGCMRPPAAATEVGGVGFGPRSLATADLDGTGGVRVVAGAAYTPAGRVLVFP